MFVCSGAVLMGLSLEFRVFQWREESLMLLSGSNGSVGFIAFGYATRHGDFLETVKQLFNINSISVIVPAEALLH